VITNETKTLTFKPVGSQLMNEAIIQAINVFGNNLKSKHLLACLGTIVFSLFWFCAIYLIAPNFYKNNPLFISIILCFLLGISWFFLNVLISILAIDSNTLDFTNDNNQSIVLVDAMLYSIVFFAPLLWLCYHYMNYFVLFSQIRPSFFFFTNTTFIWAISRFCLAYRKFKIIVKNGAHEPDNQY
jgi:hypothetical protein